MRRLAVALSIAALALAGCGGGEEPEVPLGSIDDIVVGADANGSPTIEFPADREYTQVQTRFEWEGDGDVLEKGDPILLDIYAVSLLTGDVVRTTHDDSEGGVGLPEPALLTPDHIGQELYDALLGKRAGSRILHVSPKANGWENIGAVAMVVDVVPTRATGTPQPTRTDLPIVDLGANGEPTVTLRDDPAPDAVVVQTLIQGEGEQIRKGSHVLLNYVAVDYETGEVWQSSWAPDTAPWEVQIGVGQTIPGLDNGLIDRTAGSQVLLVIPPTQAYGETALVFVVDILAVWNGDTS